MKRWWVFTQQTSSSLSSWLGGSKEATGHLLSLLSDLPGQVVSGLLFC